MTVRTPLFISLLLVLAMLAASAYAWTVLPADARIAVHWGVDGHADGFAHKPFALLWGPVFAIGLSLVLAVVTLIEPRLSNLAASAKFFAVAWTGGIAVLAVAHGAIVATALHAVFDVGAVILAAVAILFIVLGNFIGKSRSNFFAGIRTPWTLSSEYAWEHANRLAGRLFMASGAASLAALLALPARLAFFVLIGSILGSSVVAVAMSYVYWRRDPDRQATP
ncbi:MAG: SdpI family protein [Rhizomicrobium sp.]